ncbi:unnamed protein product [Cutaneotrichosporon oleaginosum]
MASGDAPQAQRLYRAGMEAYGRKAYEEALSAFDRVRLRDTTALTPGHSPRRPQLEGAGRESGRDEQDGRRMAELGVRTLLLPLQKVRRQERARESRAK